MQSIYNKYAQLLVDYCLEITDGDRLFIQSTTLAEPLIREVYRLAIRKGALVIVDLEWREQMNIFYKEAEEHQLQWISPNQEKIFREFDAYLHIRAPFNLRESQNLDEAKRQVRSHALDDLNEIYSQRTASRDLRRCLCQFPTQASAQEAGMSLEDYQQFVFKACKLYEEDPKQSWLKVREHQQHIVEYLNGVEEMVYKNPLSEITFSMKDRIWMNSDGQTNMPSGEVYSTPVEDAVNGVIHFDYPSIFRGHPIEGITLEVKDGLVVKWDAKIGQQLLDDVFAIEGARTFGEVAIGTNYDIQRPTKNILFDEKIGGTVHLAVGQSYLQTGGKNKSSIHWDMIANMKNGGEIWADGNLIYRDGQFLI